MERALAFSVVTVTAERGRQLQCVCKCMCVYAGIPALFNRVMTIVKVKTDTRSSSSLQLEECMLQCHFWAVCFVPHTLA